jgi:hypothetical protein
MLRGSSWHSMPRVCSIWQGCKLLHCHVAGSTYKRTSGVCLGVCVYFFLTHVAEEKKNPAGTRHSNFKTLPALQVVLCYSGTGADT